MQEQNDVTVALIDDDLDLAELVIAYFKQRNIKTVHFSDSRKALAAISKTAFDVVITDLNMPELTGIDLCKAMRQSGSETPVILITSSSDVEVAVEATNAGADDFVVKPLHFAQLLISVKRALQLKRVNADNTVLKSAIEISRGNNPDGMIGHSPAFKKVLELAKRVSSSPATVFISGESGSGKEVFARAIHRWSPRKTKPFVAINCSAIPDNLLESELFGHAKGAFTGAGEKKIGLFEEAEGGTLFLDEIGDLNLPLQAKLLRVIQERKIRRVGENQTRNIDVRIITATHKDLRAEVLAKRFREDLYFRLNVIPLRIPALRQRPEDILPLANFFLRKYNAINGTQIRDFTPAAKVALLENHWKGNVRELENTIERAVVLNQGGPIDTDSFLAIEEDLGAPQSPSSSDSDQGPNIFGVHYGDTFMPLREIEKRYIQHVYERNNNARDRTAKILGIDRKTLYRRLQELNTQEVH